MAVLLAIIAEFYVKGVHSVAYTYRSTLGFFIEGQWSALLAAAVNIILSIVLCNHIGPVSYTHLDVYKRQVCCGAFF